jgi:hypothetical protein
VIGKERRSDKKIVGLVKVLREDRADNETKEENIYNGEENET